MSQKGQEDISAWSERTFNFLFEIFFWMAFSSVVFIRTFGLTRWHFHAGHIRSIFVPYVLQISSDGSSLYWEENHQINLTRSWLQNCLELQSVCTRSCTLGFSQSQPQPDHVLESHILNDFMYDFSCAVSLIKTIVNYCYWQFGWILFYSRNLHISALAEVWARHLRNSLAHPQPKYEMCIFLE